MAPLFLDKINYNVSAINFFWILAVSSNSVVSTHDYKTKAHC